MPVVTRFEIAGATLSFLLVKAGRSQTGKGPRQLLRAIRSQGIFCAEGLR